MIAWRGRKRKEGERTCFACFSTFLKSSAILQSNVKKPVASPFLPALPVLPGVVKREKREKAEKEDKKGKQ